MLNILTIIGARPQIIKAAALSRTIGNRFAQTVTEKILHTGQHYDENMSGGFFGELGIPAPHYNLHVGSGKHGEQTAKMIQGIEQVLCNEHFDGMVLYGDTNSTLAGAVAASKMHVPVFHIEAGLRSFNMAMPEEVNRIVCDQLSSVLFAPTQTAIDNLKREGFTNSQATFRNGKERRVIQSGDVMYDNSMHFATMAEERSQVLERLGVQRGKFILCTIHRDNNTDSPERLSAIVSALLRIAEDQQQTIVLPLHPRTKKLLPQNLNKTLHDSFIASPYIKIVEPVPFFDIIMLERHASMVLTDSGGVQKEAFFFETPCVILRPETEWVEIVDAGAGIIADANEERIVAAYNKLAGRKVHFPPLFGDAHAAEKIMAEIIDYLK
ncbi:MAG: UDP-N-acetylglucosamine 2-epimerase (non-hydrolyzing) [Bacteroidales bacterium]|nr:UDP-N-acetylglucosamine 2-epimerase (non-hydrolyzing) [Bacteroidales bacterium]